jgi:predicted transcriptional regulator
MKTVVIDVRSLDDAFDAVERAWEGGKAADSTPRLSFVSYELMHKVLAPHRIGIVRAMAGAGPLSIREVARRVGRDFKGVHTDVAALLNNGIVAKTEDGKVIFPYDNIHVEFDISSAA